MNLSLSSSPSATSVAVASSSSSPSSSATSWFSGIVRGRADRSGNLKMAGNSGTGDGDSACPIKGKNQFRGVLFKYGPKPIQDALEIDQLVSCLINKENSEGVVLLGHSTGCQDIVHYMRTNAACSRAVRAAILQAPVSDREYRASLPETAAMIDLASTMIAKGRGSELMPREADSSSPLTAYRYHSLCAYMGDDEMFSSDLSDDQLRTRLGHMCSTPCQVICSMADEHVPEYVDKTALVERLCRAMGGAEKVEIEHGNHSLSNRVDEAVQAIIDFVKREGPKGWDDPWN
ncbi:UPF0613 protein PB24D3.06c-like isoform X4 [Hevea brasiliensis]|uniref:UPF0613 protein PB24D3.06c-like isoform X4 n=1 Tax=Hevea brasiliensis TaxID=3981 RepID=UPI0025EC97A8|nr:UPF0613 protein PB24D3.06c-like isoform X4 [Hevea brasiliensis]